MTSKITSFFQVSKSSKKGTTNNDNNTSTFLVSQKRNLEPDSLAVGTSKDNDDDVGAGGVDPSATTKSTKRVKVSNEYDGVKQLLMHLNDTATTKVSDIENGSTTTLTTTSVGWKMALQKHFESKSFQALSQFVATERMKYTIYPPAQLIWSALNACPLPRVKVVIVGQDPYHGPNQAHGLSFSVLPGCPIPPSLKNIYKELMDDPQVSNFDTMPRHGHLIRWVQQGVLLLNAVMTVRDKEPNSHQNKGWEKVTDEIIRAVLMYHCRNSNSTSTSTGAFSDTSSATNAVTHSPKGRGCVFLLWGKPATTKAMNIIESVMKQSPSTVTTTKKPKTHAIICTSHPSPLGARKTSTPFLGSHCFSRCNQELINMGHDPINWNI